MPIRGYIIEKYNTMTNAYTCNRLVQEASALDMDLQIVGIHDTMEIGRASCRERV